MYNIYRGVSGSHMVGKIRNLDKLIFPSWFLNDFGQVVVTRSAGREFQGMTTRFEKKCLSVLVLERGMESRRGWPREEGLCEKEKKSLKQSAE